MSGLRRFLFDQPAPEYIDAYYLPSPDAELRERNQMRAEEAKKRLGTRYCLYNRKTEKEEQTV